MGHDVVSVDDHTVCLPHSALQELGLRNGSLLAVVVRNGQITLQPLLAASLHELCGIFASDAAPDMVEELQQERRRDG